MIKDLFWCHFGFRICVILYILYYYMSVFYFVTSYVYKMFIENELTLGWWLCFEKYFERFTMVNVKSPVFADKLHL